MMNNELALWTSERLAQFGLLSDGGEAAVAVVEAFNESMATDVHDVLQAMDAARWDEVGRLAHRIAGSCLNLGADRLGQHCRAIEVLLVAQGRQAGGGGQGGGASSSSSSSHDQPHQQPHQQPLAELLAQLPALAERTRAATREWLLTV
jgi:HPt (histidine-containing phosphotransfer) domain-containing protein